MKQPCIVTTTTNTMELAQKIASALVTSKIAACVQIDKTHSVYIWQSKLEQVDEYRLTIKTLDQYYDRICDTISIMHTYVTPEIMKMPIIDIDTKYLSWILETLAV